MVAMIKDGSKAEVIDPTVAPKAEKPQGTIRPPTGFKFGLDNYFGVTNLTGRTGINSDGAWAGSIPNNGSAAQFSWFRGEGELAYFAWGLGGMFNSKTPTYQQPAAAFYKRQIGSGFVTVGRFLTPFGQQNWMAEPRYGLMVEGEVRGIGFAASMQYSPMYRKPNFYARAGRQLTKRTNLGVSLSYGKGVNYGTPSTYGAALDFTHDFGRGFTLSGEYNGFMGADSPFQFATMTLTLPAVGRFQPYVGAYYWHDASTDFGKFKSLLAGINYQLTPSLAIEAGMGGTNQRGVFWLQTHTKF